MGELPAIAHRVFIAASPDVVYRTLTTAAGWDGWFTQGTVLEAQPGGRFDLRWRGSGPYGVDAEDHATVREVVPDKRFAFQWNAGSAGGPTLVTIELAAEADGTRLTLTDGGHTPDQAGLNLFAECSVGWGEALTLLKFYLEHGLTYRSASQAARP